MGKRFVLFGLSGAEFSDTDGWPGQQISGANHSMGEFRKSYGEGAGEQDANLEK